MYLYYSIPAVGNLRHVERYWVVKMKKIGTCNMARQIGDCQSLYYNRGVQDGDHGRTISRVTSEICPRAVLKICIRKYADTDPRKLSPRK